MSDYLSEVFGGLFASRFVGYETREGQVALARMVAMRGGRLRRIDPCFLEEAADARAG